MRRSRCARPRPATPAGSAPAAGDVCGQWQQVLRGAASPEATRCPALGSRGGAKFKLGTHGTDWKQPALHPSLLSPGSTGPVAPRCLEAGGTARRSPCRVSQAEPGARPSPRPQRTAAPSTAARRPRAGSPRQGRGLASDSPAHTQAPPPRAAPPSSAPPRQMAAAPSPSNSARLGLLLKEDQDKADAATRISFFAVLVSTVKHS